MDRKKVKKGLYQHCEGSMFDRCGECPYYEVADKPFQCRDTLLMDAHALLKEQPEIVRCKDCRKNMMCEITIHKPKDWFCADGKKR